MFRTQLGQQQGYAATIGPCFGPTSATDHVLSLREQLKAIDVRSSARLDRLTTSKAVLAENSNIADVIQCVAEVGGHGPALGAILGRDQSAGGLSLLAQVELAIGAETRRRDAAREALALLSDDAGLCKFLGLFSTAMS